MERITTMLLQSFLINRILNPVGKLSRKLHPQARDSLFICGLLILFLQSFVHFSQIITYRYLLSFSIGCLGMGIMFFSLLTGELKPVRFRPLPLILFLSFGCTILLSGLLNKPDFLPEAIMILLVYPVFYIICAGHDASHIFRLLICGCEISFIIFLVISAALFPVSSTRYGGLFANVNMAAFYLQIVCFCYIIDFFYAEKINFSVFLKILFGASSAALLFYTNSRTGILSFLLAFFFIFVLYLVPRRFHADKAFWIKLLVYILLVAFFIAFILQIFYYINDFVLRVNHWVLKLISSSPDASDTPGDREILDLQSFIACTIEKSQVSGKDFDAISTHRFTIWKKYFTALNFRGHAEPITNTIDYGYKTITSTTAHMTVLQIAYNFGIHAGLIYLALNILSGLGTIIYAYRHYKNKYACFPLAITVLFGFTSLLASLTTSFSYMLLLYYYLVQSPLMTEQDTQ